MARHLMTSLYRCRGLSRAVVHIAMVVAVWWLLILAAAGLVPAPVASVPKIGRTAHIHVPGLPSLPASVDRAAFELAQRGFMESDEEKIEHAFTAYEWIEVVHRQSIRVLMIDEHAVEVQLLEGQHAGRRCWLKLRQISF
jgi:hypothetical protein